MNIAELDLLIKIVDQSVLPIQEEAIKNALLKKLFNYQDILNKCLVFPEATSVNDGTTGSPLVSDPRVKILQHNNGSVGFDVVSYPMDMVPDLVTLFFNNINTLPDRLFFYPGRVAKDVITGYTKTYHTGEAVFISDTNPPYTTLILCSRNKATVVLELSLEITMLLSALLKYSVTAGELLLSDALEEDESSDRGTENQQID